MNKFIFLGLVLTITVLTGSISNAPKIYAADATPAAKQASPSGSLTDKINKLKEEIASRAASLRMEVSKKLQNKAVFGLIENIEGEKINLTQNGQNRTVITSEYSEIFSTVRNSTKLVTIKLKDLEPGEFISVMGDIDDKSSLNAKRIVKSPAIASDSSKLVWGITESISATAIKIKTKEGKSQNIQTDFKTLFVLGGEEGSFSDIKNDRTIIARVSESKANLFYASYIYIIPQSDSDKPDKKSASPSAQVSATPSASPKK